MEKQYAVANFSLFTFHFSLKIRTFAAANNYSLIILRRKK